MRCWNNATFDPAIEIKARNRFIRLRNILNGAETWTLKTLSMNKVEAFKVWTYCKICCIPYTAHMTNEKVGLKLEKFMRTAGDR